MNNLKNCKNDNNTKIDAFKAHETPFQFHGLAVSLRSGGEAALIERLKSFKLNSNVLENKV